MDKEKIREEINFLWSFWLTHSCKKCTDDPKRRLPTKRFPALFEMLKELTIEKKKIELVKSCLNCWSGENEPEICAECGRMPRVWEDHWKPKE